MANEFFDLKVNKGFAPGHSQKDLRIGRWVKVTFENPIQTYNGIIYGVKSHAHNYKGAWDVRVMTFEDSDTPFMRECVDQTQIIEYGPMASPPAFK